MQDQTAQIFVVTGASSGIGREIAIQLAAPQRVIWLIGRDQGRLEEAAAAVRAKGAVPEIARMDLTDLDSADRFLRETFPAGVRVDSVYLAAAVTLFGEVQNTLPEDWDKIYRTNLLSPVQWCRHFYANMVGEKSGNIILVSSLAAYAGYPTATAYASMKAGLLGLYRSLWHEAKSHGVSIYIASPGYVDTGIYKSAVFRNTTYEKTMNLINGLGFRILSAEETARKILVSVNRGESEFALPAYASVMKWVAPRMPFLIDIVHARMVKCFRQIP
ncbi:MAG: SDR family oxidoreductase [Luteolibacter sp.]